MTQRHSVLLTIELGNCYCNCYSPIVTVIVTVIISLFPPRGNWKMKAVSLERLTQVEKVAAVLNRTVLNHRITTVLNWGRSKLGRVTKPTVLLGKFCEGFPHGWIGRSDVSTVYSCKVNGMYWVTKFPATGHKLQRARGHCGLAKVGRVAVLNQKVAAVLNRRVTRLLIHRVI